MTDAMNLFDSRYGPFLGLNVTRAPGGRGRWYIAMCSIARAPAGQWFNPMPTGAAGTSRSEEEARAKALGEAIERYSGLYSSYYDKPFHAALGDGQYYDEYPRCADDEACGEDYRQYSRHDVVSHTVVTSLVDGTNKIVPSTYCHLGYLGGSGERRILPPISTGLAFHTDLSKAIWSGVCEVLERDALSISWLCNSLVRIDLSDAPLSLTCLVREIESLGLTADFYDISPRDAILPSVMCLLRGETFPYCAVGAACNVDAVDAASKALSEAVSVRSYAESRFIPSIQIDIKQFGWVRTLDDHAMLYALWKEPTALKFLSTAPSCKFGAWQTSFHVESPGDENALREVAKRMELAGLPILWKDVTAPELTEYGHVVKVIIPSAVPLSQAWAERWLATPRLKDFLYCAERGGANEYPHPFA